jgi:hypothetical protein
MALITMRMQITIQPATKPSVFRDSQSHKTPQPTNTRFDEKHVKCDKHSRNMLAEL